MKWRSQHFEDPSRQIGEIYRQIGVISILPYIKVLYLQLFSTWTYLPLPHPPKKSLASNKVGSMSFVTITPSPSRSTSTLIASSSLGGSLDYTSFPPYIIRRVYVSNGGFSYSSGCGGSSGSSKGLSVGAIIGIVLGGLFACGIIVGLLSYRVRDGRFPW